MKTGGRILFCNLMLTLVLASAEIFARDSSGMVVVSRGDVTIISNGETRPLKRGEFLHEYDEITAGDRSFTVLQFVDGTKVNLHPDSSLIIEQYLYASTGEDAVTLSLVSGGLRVVSGIIANTRPENFKIRTPLALMSVQGTEGSLTLCGENICEQEGMVEVK